MPMTDEVTVDLTPIGLHRDHTPALGAFVDAVDTLVDPTRPDTFWAAEGPLRELLRAGVVTDLVNRELSIMVREPRYAPEGLTPSGEWRLGRVGGGWLVLHLVNNAGDVGPDRRAYAGSDHNLVGHAWGDPLPVDWYTQPRPHPNDVFDRDRLLGPREHRILEPGGVMALEAGRHVGRFRPAPGAAAVVVKLVSAPVLPLIWEYDLDTGRPERAITGAVTSSRLELLAGLMADMGEVSTVPTLRRLAASHEHHFVRWAAVRAVAALDPDEGEALVRAALDDPHPHVRRAAARALTPVEGVH